MGQVAFQGTPLGSPLDLSPMSRGCFVTYVARLYQSTTMSITTTVSFPFTSAGHDHGVDHDPVHVDDHGETVITNMQARYFTVTPPPTVSGGSRVAT